MIYTKGLRLVGVAQVIVDVAEFVMERQQVVFADVAAHQQPAHRHRRQPIQKKGSLFFLGFSSSSLRFFFPVIFFKLELIEIECLEMRFIVGFLRFSLGFRFTQLALPSFTGFCLV